MLPFASQGSVFGGIGSLGPSAMGNPFSGDPLGPYRQYLQQTYAVPAQNRVNSFIQALQEQERSFFGSPSPLSAPGGMQTNALASQQPAPTALDFSDPYDGMRGFGVMPMGQVGTLSGNPMQAAMQSGTFDAQVAALKNTPSIPGLEPARRREGGPSGYGGGVPQIQGASPFGNSLPLQQQLSQGRMDAMQPSGVAVNQANLANAQFTAPSAAPGTTIADAFASRFGENWADQFSLTTPNNRARFFGLV